MKDYKKSYKGLVIWTLCFIGASIGAVFIAPDAGSATVLSMNIMTVSVAVLMLMIYFNEKIYWFTGVLYEDARKMTSEQRKRFAWKYFIRFFAVAVIYIIYSVPALIFEFPVWITTLTGCAAVIAAAISTVNIKPE